MSTDLNIARIRRLEAEVEVRTRLSLFPHGDIDRLQMDLKNLESELVFTAHRELPVPVPASPATGALFDETAEPS